MLKIGLILVLAVAVSDQKRARLVPSAREPDYIREPEILGISIEETPNRDKIDPNDENAVVIGWEDVYGTITTGELIPTDDESQELQGVASKPLQNYASQSWREGDFKCPKRYAFYKYEGKGSCDIYIECRNFKPTRKVCPDGMHFKQNPRWSEYPCAYPPEAKCLVRDGALPARPTAECPHQFGNYPLTSSNKKYSSHDRCRKYISCANGISHLMNCTFGLVFNPELKLCDWPEKVPGCENNFNFRCPVPHLGEEDMVINYRFPSDPECRYFYSCLNGDARVLSCDEGLLFDHRIGRCVEYDEFNCDYDKKVLDTSAIIDEEREYPKNNRRIYY